MSPTIRNGERLVYQKRVWPDELRRDRVIVFRTSDRSAWSPGSLAVVRILALPGDRMAVSDDQYWVNGVAGPSVGNVGDGPPVVDVPQAPAEFVVPEDCYFVRQDDPTGSFDSSVLSWAERKHIVGTRVWYLRSEAFLKLVE